MQWQDGITLGIALLGAILGVYNAWNTWKSEKVSFDVFLEFLDESYTASEYGITIRVVNRSKFPIFVRRIGFQIPDKKLWRKCGEDGRKPVKLTFPYEIAPGAHLPAIDFCVFNQVPNIPQNVTAVVVETTCGKSISITKGPVVEYLKNFHSS